MQHLLKITFIRNHLYSKAVAQFLAQQQEKGITLEAEETLESLYGVRTVLVDAPLLMQGRNAVRRLAAPLDLCEVERFTRQRAWMVLAAGIAVGCDGYAPLYTFAKEHNFSRERMLKQYPQVDVLRYDDARGIETTIHRDRGGLRIYSKGDPASLLSRCTYVLDGKERPMLKRDMERAVQAAGDMEAAGLETLAFATRWLQEPCARDAYEQDLLFLGIVGTGDLPQPDAPWTMEALRGAGTRPVLISGEELTPGAVRSIGVLRPEAGIITGEEMDAMEDAFLRESVQHADAYLGIGADRMARLIGALETDGVVAVLREDPEEGGLRMTLGAAEQPQVRLKEGGLAAVIRLLGDCRALCDGFRAG